jgi:hypothetical protein
MGKGLFDFGFLFGRLEFKGFLKNNLEILKLRF